MTFVAVLDRFKTCCKWFVEFLVQPCLKVEGCRPGDILRMNSMAFGFAAYCSKDYSCPIPGVNLRVLVRKAVRALSWKIKEDSYEQIITSKSMNLWTYGETIRIRFLSNTSVSIHSKCSMPTQCIDWGQNKRNVMRLIRKIEEAALEPELP